MVVETAASSERAPSSGMPRDASDGRQSAINAQLANLRTPFVFNCWYVAGWTSDFTRSLVERVLLGRSLVFYRCEDGELVALHNRCPHRSYPLVHGRLEGDVLRCGYHGIAFGRDGRCVDVPAQERAPRSVCTRRYPVVERGPLVWVWLGESQLADPQRVPATPWLDSPGWSHAAGYLKLEASYVYLHENLLDLSHFTYLHPDTLGTPEYARTPFEVTEQGDQVRIVRNVAACEVPPMYRSTGIAGQMSRLTESEFTTPGVHRASVRLTDLAPSPGARTDFQAQITHFVTPADSQSTHYWFTFARDFAVGDLAVTESFRRQALKAFEEDRQALEEAARMYRLDPQAVLAEIHVSSDRAGVAARRILRRLATDAD